MRLRAFLESVASAIFHRSRVEAEMEEEMCAHIQSRADDLERAGLPRAEAERRARVEFGGVERFKEECREWRGAYFLETLLQDVRFGLRMLRKSPGFTVIAIIALALGIGANAAIFSVVNAILLRPLPYEHPSQLVFITETNPRSTFGKTSPSLPDIQDWRASSKTIAELAAFTWQNYFLTGSREPQLIWGLCVSPEFFSTLGVEPWRGRTFSAKEVRTGRHVVVISNELWRERFGGRPGAVGRTVVLNDMAYTVIGILPARFRFPPVDPIPGMNPQIFAPLAATPAEATERSDRMFDAIARMKAGVSVRRCQAELSAIASELARRYPATNAGWGIKLTSFNESASGKMRVPLLILACAVGLVLLLACANVANLLLARNVSREQEIALRCALGASPSRVVRQMLTESLLLALVAAAVGTVGAMWALKLLVSALPAQLNPTTAEIGINGTVIAFSLLLAVLTTLLFGLLPALRALRPDVQQGVKSGAAGFSTHSHRGTSRALATLQVAISMILLIGAGLLIHSMARLLASGAGFQAGGVLTARLELPANRYPTREAIETFHQSVIEKIRALPGVESAADVMTLPLSGRSTMMHVEPEGDRSGAASRVATVEYNAVTAGYFQTMRVALLGGRFFTETDGQNTSQVAIVNEKMAREFWPHENPVGRYFRFGGSSWTPWLRVVGVVGNEKYWSLTDQAKSEFYLPYAEAARFGATYLMRVLTFLVVRSKLHPQALAAEIRAAVWKVDPDEPVAEIKTMNRLVSESVAPRRFATLLLSLLGGLAGSLAIVGLFGVMAFSVAGRTREIGIRLALGAQRRGILSMVLREGMGMAGLGITIGTVGALALTKFLRSLLFGIQPNDPTTFAIAVAVLAAAALLACYVPARRAMRVDPMTALRNA